MLLFGKNAVTEALRGETTVEKVLISKDVPVSGEVVDLCKKRSIPYRFADKRELDRLSPDGRHRGFIGFATEFQYTELEDILENKKGNLLLLLLDGIEDPHNLGAIIRVAECAGADGIAVPKRRCCGVTDVVVKISCGATSHVKIAKVNNLNDVIRDLKDRNVTVLCADMDGDSAYKTDMTGDVALIIGSEGNGVHQLTKKLCDGVVSLPQNGKINSLNASVATGIFLYEIVRQRCE